MNPSIVKRCLVGTVLAIAATLPGFQQLHTSVEGLKLIADYEGCRLQPYQCSAGSGTIYGMYVIEGLNQTKTEFFRDGMPRRIEFTLSLKRVDESLSDMFGDLSTQLNNLQDTATSALSDISKTVGGLLS